ncbi:hypothetical protein CBF23_000770 [Marinomonas agarivorans]|nr:hypothetical protein CBF23_000770 [Marinomonas agarivorans]
MNTRNQFISRALNEFRERISEHSPFNQESLSEEDQDFIDTLNLLIQAVQQQSVHYAFQGQDLLTRFIRCYPNLTPLIRRELLWFIGGECLHYLGDEEVYLFQELEERLYTLESQHTDVDIEAEIKSLRETMNHSTNQTKH